MQAAVLKRAPAISSVLSRYLHSSGFVCKQPAHDRQRRRRKFQPPFHRNPFYDEDPILNLKLSDLLPKTSPEFCGSTNPKIKNDFFKKAEALRKYSSLFDRLNELYYHEDNMWFHRLEVPLPVHETLDFVQHIVRTQLFSLSQLSLPVRMPENFGAMLQRRLEYLMATTGRPLGAIDMMEYAYSAMRETSMIPLHVSDIQIATGGKVETFFKRFGYAQLFEQEKDSQIAHGVWEPTSETVLDAQGMLHFNIRSQLAWQLRAKRPLPPFVPPESLICFEDVNLPKHIYRPEVFGLEPIEAYDFSCVPFSINKISSEYVRSIAGYWPDTPFWDVGGDPCQFARLGVLHVDGGFPFITQPPSDTNAFSPLQTLAERDALSNGILTAFAWASAIAYNQGASLYQEVSQPVTVQLLLMHGEGTQNSGLQSLCFQLNSLTGLWKAEDAGMPFNLAWYSPVHPLYLSSTFSTPSNDSIKMNPAAVSLLTEALIRGTASYEVDDGKPTAVDSQVVAPRRLIPSSDSLLIDRQQAKVNGQQTGRLELTQKEHDALVAIEGESAKRKDPPRLKRRRMPHPNHVFFLRMTEKENLVREMREQMPVFGEGGASVSGRLMSDQYRQALAEHELWLRSRKTHVKVRRLPPSWR